MNNDLHSTERSGEIWPPPINHPVPLMPRLSNRKLLSVSCRWVYTILFILHAWKTADAFHQHGLRPGILWGFLALLWLSQTVRAWRLRARQNAANERNYYDHHEL